MKTLIATGALAATVKVLNEHDAGEPIDYTNYPPAKEPYKEG